jgi:hypothetical protein
MTHWAKLRRNPPNIIRTIVGDGQVTGNIGSWIAEDRRLIGYWVGREFWGRGVATAALAAFVAEVKERPLHAFGQAQRPLHPGSGEMQIRPVPRARSQHRRRRRGTRVPLHALAPRSMIRGLMAHALDAGLRLCFNRASLARASNAHRSAKVP